MGSVPAMRLMAATVLVTLLASACTAARTPAPAESAIVVPPQLLEYSVAMVQVGDREMLLAIADSPSLRAQGLQGVTDLEDLDGMLFFWRRDGEAFWMKDTLIPLDIVWFNADGTFKGRASMTPCPEDPCPTYAPDDFNFRFAIEANPGDLDWIDESTVILYPD